MLKVLTTTTSVGVAILANWVFISERTYSKRMGKMASQALRISSNTTSSIFLMMRCSVGVKSRPSTRMWKRPSPPNRLSTTRNTRLGSNTNSEVPRKGFMCTMIEVGRDHQVAHELAVLDDRNRPHRDLGAAPDQVEQADAEIACETFVDDFQRRHAPPHDAFLTADIIGAHPSRAFLLGRLLRLAGYAA
jgi:hypothetical protein